METQQATINLVKGQKVDLTKTNPGLKVICFGLGWDLQPGVTFDLDAFALPLDANGKGKQEDVVYFNRLNANGISHSGDNLTGAGDGDDEVITVDTEKLPASAEKVVIGINIYNASSNQNFGQVKGAFCRAFAKETPEASIIKYDLNEDYSANTGVIMGELYKKDGEWKFAAIGQGANGSIIDVLKPYF